MVRLEMVKLQISSSNSLNDSPLPQKTFRKIVLKASTEYCQYLFLNKAQQTRGKQLGEILSMQHLKLQLLKKGFFYLITDNKLKRLDQQLQ